MIKKTKSLLHSTIVIIELTKKMVTAQLIIMYFINVVAQKIFSISTDKKENVLFSDLSVSVVKQH